MSFSEVIVDSLRYPFTDVKKLLTFFILLIGWIVIIPGIMAFGYLLRIIEYTLKGSPKLPDFNDKSELIEEGLKFIAVSIIYRIPYFLTIGIIIFIQIKEILLSPIILLIILLAVELLTNLFFIIGLSNMVYEKKTRAAFDFKMILELIKNIGWKKYLAYLVIFTLMIELFAIINNILSPLIGSTGIMSVFGVLFISFVLNSYLLIFENRFRGLIYPNKLESPE